MSPCNSKVLTFGDKMVPFMSTKSISIVKDNWCSDTLITNDKCGSIVQDDRVKTRTPFYIEKLSGEHENFDDCTWQKQFKAYIHSCSFKRPGYPGSHHTYTFQSSTSCLMFAMWRVCYCQILTVWKSSPLRKWRNLTFILLLFFQWFRERHLTKLYFLFIFHKAELFCHYSFWG